MTTTADDGPGSLRAAIVAIDGGASPASITFAIPGSGVQTIGLLSPLPALTVPVVIDGTTQPGYAGTPLIELNGSGAGSGAYGLVIAGGASTVKGLTVDQFDGANLVLQGGGGNVVQSNFIGTNTAGNGAFGVSGAGILIDGGSSGNLIGTNADGVNDAAERNVISGNAGDGILVTGSGTTANVIAGNFIGTDVSGTMPLGNGTNGIELDSGGNTVGGAIAAQGNTVSANGGSGIYVDAAAAGNVIAGNRLGTDVTGLRKLANLVDGVTVDGSANSIGGTAAGAGNLISANFDAGILIDPGANANVVQGNKIGTNIAGSTALPNVNGGVIDEGTGNTLGGTVAGAGNLISANDAAGIDLYGASDDLVAGNLIGTNAAGTSALGNSGNGITIEAGASGNTIGAPGPGANVIAYNNSANFFGQGGVVVLGTSTGNDIEFNSIHNNRGLGIDLGGDGVTPNANTGTGPNGDQPYPVITSIVPSGTTTTVSGTVSGPAGASFVLDFYVNPAPDPSLHGQGQTDVGSSPTLTWGADGTAAFSVTLPFAFVSGQYLSATATGPNGTSEFSMDAGAQSVPTITWATPDPIVYGTPLGATQLDATASVPGSFTYSPPLGTVLGTGSAQVLTVTFTPTDSTDYTTATDTVYLHVFKAASSFNALAAPVATYGDPTVTVSGQVASGSYVPGGDVAVTFNGSTEYATLDPSGDFSVAVSTSGLAVSTTPYPVTCDYLGSQNFLGVSDSSLGVTVNPRLLSVSSDDGTRLYGDPNPALAGTITGVVPGDGITASFTTAADATSGVGSYGIVPVLSDPNGKLSNYTVTLTDGNLAITPAPLAVTANDASTHYGGPVPALGATVVGAKNGDNTSGGLVVTLTTTASSASPVGTYAIVPEVSGPAAGNYAVTTSSGALTVAPAPLTITADDQTKIFGAPLPDLTVSYAGFVNGDSPANLASPPIASTTATPSSTVAGGPYAINVSGAVDPNYQIQYESGSLIVVAADSALALATSSAVVPAGQAVVLTATAAAVAPGAGVPTGSVTFYDGANPLGSAPLIGGAATLSVATLCVGTHAIDAVYAGDGNFNPSTSASLSETVLASVYVLDPSAPAALSLWGNAELEINGALIVDSSATSAIVAAGNAQLNAESITVAGGYRVCGQATLNPSPTSGAAAAPDPLAGLAAPTPAQAGAVQGAVNLSGHASLTIGPGVYTGIHVSGNASLTLSPGIYVLAGGGFSVSGNAHVGGAGVLLYNAGSDYPATGGPFGGIAVLGNAALSLTPATTGPYANILLFQARDNATPLVLTDSAAAALGSGTIYAPSALLAVVGNTPVTLGEVVVDRLLAAGDGRGDGSCGGSQSSNVGADLVVIDSQTPDHDSGGDRHRA